jgi:hypothetical protein
MNTDDSLEKLLDAIEIANYWDVEVYAQQVLDRLHQVKPQYRDQIKKQMEDLIFSAQEEYKKERAKNDLINEIMKPKK